MMMSRVPVPGGDSPPADQHAALDVHSRFRRDDICNENIEMSSICARIHEVAERGA
jgi:hypothetical protein